MKLNEREFEVRFARSLGEETSPGGERELSKSLNSISEADSLGFKAPLPALGNSEL